jgi:hypothetical protein
MNLQRLLENQSIALPLMWNLSTLKTFKSILSGTIMTSFAMTSMKSGKYGHSFIVERHIRWNITRHEERQISFCSILVDQREIFSLIPPSL